ncbi:MAG: HAD family hydrolase [Candidatus Melainabacteria bacterium]|nr:MAG: HAD family hydrolase [Candidatus Melainabacteria bacterium]
MNANPRIPVDVLISDVDNTMLPYITGFLYPAITAGVASIARLFHMNPEEMVRCLAPTMKQHGHDNPWLIELSPLRKKFVGTDAQFIDMVVRPFWLAWDEAAEMSGQAYPGVIKTLETINDLGKRTFALSNGRDFCVIQRLRAAGLLQYIEGVAAVQVRNKGGFDTTVYDERRARILSANSDVNLTILQECASKPSGAGLATILELAAVDVNDCIFTGDALELDGVAAAALGMQYVWMAPGGIFLTRDIDVMFAGAPIESARQRHNLSVPVMHEAHRFDELLKFF